MTTHINNKLEKYGANILAVPETDTLPLSYGGLSLGGISFEMREINQVRQVLRCNPNKLKMPPMWLPWVPWF